MSLGKSLGGAILFYIVLNMVFLFIFIGVGGLTGIAIGEFFGLIGQDTFGFLSVLVGPGGAPIYTGMTGFQDPIAGVYKCLSNAAAGTNVPVNVVGMLWILGPGLITGIVAGAKLSENSNKSAFVGVFLAVLILTLIPMLLNLLSQIDPVISGHTISQFLVHPMFMPNYADKIMGPLVFGVFSGIIYGGIAAVSASNV